MTRFSRRSLSRSAVAAYLCICAALVLLLALSLWGAYRDLAALRQVMLRAEMSRLHSHAQRTVGRIERDLELDDATELDALRDSAWLDRHWQQFIGVESQMYAAVVDNEGRIVHHSNGSLAGQPLPNNWYDHIAHELGDDVVVTTAGEHSLGHAAYNTHLPIVADQRQLGEYHVGNSIAAIEDRVGRHERAFLQRRALLVGGVLLIVLLATTSLYFIATHSISLHRNLAGKSMENATEVGALAAGLAHEIRNPLHAIQLNLHTLNRASQRGHVISADEMKSILDESSQEIDRIEQLMQQLVGFATPEEPRDETIDLADQVNSVVDFLGQEMLANNVEVVMDGPRQGVYVRMDHGRLRQIMLNLLQNAQQAMPEGGRVRVTVRRLRNCAEIIVSDNGPGIVAAERARILEPFYSTKDSGTGLGLALVKRFVDEAKGSIRIEAGERRQGATGGTTFRIVLPAEKTRKVNR